MLFMLPLLAFAGLCTSSPVSPGRDAVASSACATAVPILGMSCTDHTSPNGTQGALYIHSNLTPRRDPALHGQLLPRRPGPAPITECGTSLVQDGSPNDGSPDAADCAAIASFAQSHTGFWTLTPENLRADPWTVVVVYQTCALVMTTLDGAVPRWPIYVGDQDVATAVQSACDKYTSANGKLDATAVMGCNTSDGRGGEDRVQATFWLRNSAGIITK
ncbi:uncharacterized protein PG986_006474 [Apiospora aurea]|uniref:Ecp2 effector protein-like domain-containing protein n=1 Tax=Apiospora aurea TaxID=335848 RepID=A0ABR1QLB8_9PEZI